MSEQTATTPKIQVLVRKRPLTTKEQKKGDIDIVKVIDEQTLVIGEVKYAGLTLGRNWTPPST